MMQYNKKLIEFDSYMKCGGYRMNKYGQYMKGRWPFRSGCWISYPSAHTIYVIGLTYEEVERVKEAYCFIFGTVSNDVNISTMDGFSHEDG